MISDFNRGVAIKVRDSLKSRNEEITSWCEEAIAKCEEWWIRWV
jgi:hypothetical protein